MMYIAWSVLVILVYWILDLQKACSLLLRGRVVVADHSDGSLELSVESLYDNILATGRGFATCLHLICDILKTFPYAIGATSTCPPDLSFDPGGADKGILSFFVVVWCRIATFVTRLGEHGLVLCIVHIAK